MLSFMIYLDRDCCTGCGQCVNICPLDVFRLDDEVKADPYRAGACEGCGGCVEVCPDKCIEVREL